MMKQLRCIGFLLAVSLSVWAETQLYTVQDGETLEQISVRFLGEAQAVPELLEFNNISNPAAVVSGTVLALPGDVRKKALLSIQEAEAAMVQCIKDGAEVLAPDEYAAAKGSLDAAVNALRFAAYEKAQGLAKISEIKAKDVSALAGQRALISPEAIFAKVNGLVQFRLDGETDWTHARTGLKLPWKSVVRTDARSRAIIDLPDGSSVQILESSELNLAKYVEDTRTRTTRTRLKLQLGEIIGRIKPKTNEESSFIINSQEAALTIRGTVLRIAQNAAATTRLMTLKGLVAAEQAGETVEVPAGFGVSMEAGKAPKKVVPLLEPPALTVPEAGRIQTARQQVTLSWSALDEERLAAYHLELATDTDFQNVIHIATLEGTETTTMVLDKDVYYVRIASVDVRGLVGPWSDLGELDIRPNREIRMTEPETAATIQEKRVVPGGAPIHLSPAEEDTSVVSYEYRLKRGDFLPGSDTIILTETGDYTVEARGIGLDGKKGKIQRLELSVDATPPEVTTSIEQSIKPPGGSSWERLAFTATDNLGVDRIEYSVDGGPMNVYTGSVSLPDRRYYLIRYRAVDQVGNASRVRSLKVRGGPQYLN